MLNNTTIIHLIDNKPEEVYEENLLVYIESAKAINNEYFQKYSQVIFTRPGDKYEISDRVKNEISNINGVYQTLDFDPIQIHDKQNFTLIPQFCYKSSLQIDTDYLLWHDLDVLILSDAAFNFGKTDKIITSLIKIPKSNRDYDEIVHDIITNNSFQDAFQDIYKHLIKQYLPKEYQIGELTHYMNTWVLYGKKDNVFWKEWIYLTEVIIKIIQDKYPELIEYELESIGEELAGSILYGMNNSLYVNINPNYYSLGDSAYSKDTRVMHYEEFYYCNNIIHIMGKLLQKLELLPNLIRKGNITPLMAIKFKKEWI